MPWSITTCYFSGAVLKYVCVLLVSQLNLVFIVPENQISIRLLGQTSPCPVGCNLKKVLVDYGLKLNIEPGNSSCLSSNSSSHYVNVDFVTHLLMDPIFYKSEILFLSLYQTEIIVFYLDMLPLLPGVTFILSFVLLSW